MSKKIIQASKAPKAIGTYSQAVQKGNIVSFQGNVLAIVVAKIMCRKIIIRCNTAPSKYINNSYKRLFFGFFYSFADLISETALS